MDLYFMRHGIAEIQEESGISSDAERPLTAKGVKRLQKVAKGILVLGISFDHVLTSPLLRARQSADLIAKTLNMRAAVEELPELAPESSPRELLSSLGQYHDSKALLLVGHQPLLGTTVSLLLSKGDEMDVRLKKGGVCYVEVGDPALEGSATLHWMLTPKQLRRLAGR